MPNGTMDRLERAVPRLTFPRKVDTDEPIMAQQKGVPHGSQQPDP